MRDKVKAATIKEKAKKDKKKDRKDKDDTLNAPALWLLIRQVNVRCNTDTLKTGSRLVNLPGVADANTAYNDITKDYMKKCQCIWILVPITRAVNDKTTRDLLGDAFKMQLMNNKLSNSKSGSNLGPEEMDNKEPTPETLKSKITASKTKVKDLQGCQSEAHKQKKTLGDQLATLKKQHIIL
ncbi:hypothetical protein CPB85DRAFT_1445513 [Mucidula mucida]|nr:hypothetical protein CPB85DRAFT_1445513 [Mucidula mucida]